MSSVDRLLLSGAPSLLALLLAWATPAAFASPGFEDPLDHPALAVSNVSKRPLQSVVQAGPRLVAVGARGMVIVSRDNGSTWTQAQVPVQSDLLAAHFPTPTTGWAVGHDGVVLRTDDGGERWVKQLDGRSAAAQFRQYYQTRATSGDEAAKRALAQIDQNFKVPGSLPYLDVWFEDVDHGYAVGSFGMLIKTSDGGKTWTPWLDRIDNDQSLNLNAVRAVGGSLVIAGERGRIYRLDREKGRFESVSTGYAGSFFGLVANASTTLAYGLRGVVYKSDKQGKSWQAVTMPAEATISAASVRPSDSAFVLVNGAGQLLVGDAQATSFRIVQPAQRMRLTGVVALPDSAVLTGLAGVATEALTPQVK